MKGHIDERGLVLVHATRRVRNAVNHSEVPDVELNDVVSRVPCAKKYFLICCSRFLNVNFAATQHITFPSNAGALCTMSFAS